MPAGTISDYYHGRSILVTGFTGFLGKILTEKLLRTCPSVNKIYLVMRTKKSKTPESRLNEIINSPLFDLVRKPELLDKLIIVKGDITEVGLGLSKEDESMLIENVSVVFHLAASVRFDDPLAKAIFTNMRGTHELVKLATKMKNISTFVHTSTTYCQIDKQVANEEIYPAPRNWDWKTLIAASEMLDGSILDGLTMKILDQFPNTYTFTKRMSEHILEDYKEELKFVVVRPSIVMNLWKEPLPGWIDNFNGPQGISLGGAKGAWRVINLRLNAVPDLIPGDKVINVLMTAAWSREAHTNGNEIEVFHASACKKFQLSNEEILRRGLEMIHEIPLYPVVWYPSFTFVSNKNSYYLLNLLLHFLPSVGADILIRAIGKRPFLLRLRRKMHMAVLTLRFFFNNDWEFTNDKSCNLDEMLTEKDKETFGFGDLESLRNSEELSKYFRAAYIAGKVYLLKESLSNIPEKVAYLRRMYWLDRIVNTMLMVLAMWIAFKFFL